MDRRTSVWVPVDMLVPHPSNSNKMSDEMFAKLEANVTLGGELPIVIVRSLELSEAFTEERDAGKLQIIDGEHRWRLAGKLTRKEIEVRVWPGVSDSRAEMLLLTLNHIHGDPDKAKRARAIRNLAEIEPDLDALATYLPERADEIRKLVEEINREAVQDATQRARKVSAREPMTIFVMPDQAEKILRAIKTAYIELDAKHQNADCEEGEALAHVCSTYLLGTRAPEPVEEPAEKPKRRRRAKAEA
jgi:hypothetical protein